MEKLPELLSEPCGMCALGISGHRADIANRSLMTPLQTSAINSYCSAKNNCSFRWTWADYSAPQSCRAGPAKRCVMTSGDRRQAPLRTVSAARVQPRARCRQSPGGKLKWRLKARPKASHCHFAKMRSFQRSVSTQPRPISDIGSEQETRPKLFHARATQPLQVVLPVGFLLDRHLVGNPVERNIGLSASKLLQ